jgi:hypothetical protein
MTPTGLLEIAVFFLVLLALTKPLGAYMARVYQGERTWLDPLLVPVERAIHRASGIDWQQEHGWRAYTAAMLLFNLLGLLLTYAIPRLQSFLPFNPQDLSGVARLNLGQDRERRQPAVLDGVQLRDLPAGHRPRPSRLPGIGAVGGDLLVGRHLADLRHQSHV